MVTILCYIKNVARTHISISFITLGGLREEAPTPSNLRAFADCGSPFFAYYHRFTTFQYFLSGCGVVKWGQEFFEEIFESLIKYMKTPNTFMGEAFYVGRDKGEE